jgi:hypothetical protein
MQKSQIILCQKCSIVLSVTADYFLHTFMQLRPLHEYKHRLGLIVICKFLCCFARYCGINAVLAFSVPFKRRFARCSRLSFADFHIISPVT